MRNALCQNLLTQILEFFGEFKGVALKNPIRGFAPEPHELIEKSSTKTFNCHR